MAQYCRYCSIAIPVGEDQIYCRKKNIVFTAKQAKHTNNCKLFDLNEIDALRQNDKGYIPTGVKPLELGGLGKQITLKDLLSGDAKDDRSEGLRRSDSLSG